MSAEITDEQLEQLKKSLGDEHAMLFERISSAIALQAEIIDDLLWKLEIQEGAAAMRRRLMGPALAQLAAKLERPAVKGPTLEEISQSIHQMQEDIEKALGAQAITKTVLNFALKMAPLL